jgi:predicted alpha/beta hydrolase family esterase
LNPEGGGNSDRNENNGMSTIVVSHGLGASPDSVWFPWFATELEARGHRVVIPAFPEPGKPDPLSWLQSLAQTAAEAPAADTVLVGHSIGGVNVLRMLETSGDAFAGAVLVSTASHEVGYDMLAGFFKTPFDWDRIRAAARKFRILAAVDDPVNTPDPVEHVAELVRGLAATATVLPDGGHLGAFPDDHIRLPEAVRLTLDCLNA